MYLVIYKPQKDVVFGGQLCRSHVWVGSLGASSRGVHPIPPTQWKLLSPLWTGLHGLRTFLCQQTPSHDFFDIPPAQSKRAWLRLRGPRRTASRRRPPSAAREPGGGATRWTPRSARSGRPSRSRTCWRRWRTWALPTAGLGSLLARLGRRRLGRGEGGVGIPAGHHCAWENAGGRRDHSIALWSCPS